MLRLSAIVLDGFKSFPSHTKVELSAPFICLVGPNGGGKSNLLDAIYFALGEGSTRRLRVERMSELVYRGPRGERSVAQVRLEFVLAGELGEEGERVVLTRRLDSQGNSEYTLNGRPILRREIGRLLASLLAEGEVGAGIPGVFTISQGEVEKELLATPQELREFFFRATGVAPLLSELELAEGKLAEAEKDLAGLRQEVEKLAERELQLREARVRLLLSRLYGLVAERFERLAQQSRQAEVEGKRRQLEDQLREKKSQVAELSTQRDELKERLSKLSVELARLREDYQAGLKLIAELTQRREARRTQTARLQSTITELERSQREISEQSSREASNLRLVEEKLGQTIAELGRLTREHEQAVQQRQQAEEELKDLKGEMARRRQEQIRMRGELDQLRSRQTRLDYELREIARQRDELADRMGSLRERLEAARREEASRREQLEQLTEEITRVRRQLEEEARKLAQQEERLAQLSEEQNERASREGALRLEAEMIRLRLSQQGEGKGEERSCPPEGIPLVERYPIEPALLARWSLLLAPLRRSFLVEESSSPPPGVEKGSGVLIPSPLPEMPLDEKGERGARELSRQTGLPLSLCRLLWRYWGEIKLVELEPAEAGQRSQENPFTLVSAGGNFVAKGGILLWRGDLEEVGEAELSDRLARLEEELARLSDQCREGEAEVLRTTHKVEEMRRHLLARREQLARLDERDQALRRSLEQHVGLVESLTTEQELTGQAIAELARRETELREEREALGRRTADLEEKLAEVERALESLLERVAQAEQRLGTLQSRESQIGGEMQKFAERRAMLENHRKELVDRLDKLGEKHTEVEETLVEARRELEELAGEKDDEMERLVRQTRQRVEEQAGQVEKLETEERELRQRLALLEPKIETLSREVAELEGKIARLSGWLESSRESLLEKSGEEDELTAELSQALSERLPPASLPLPTSLPTLNDYQRLVNQRLSSQSPFPLPVELLSPEKVIPLAELGSAKASRYARETRRKQEELGGVNELAHLEHAEVLEKLSPKLRRLSEAENALENLSQAVARLREGASRRHRQVLEEISHRFGELIRQVFTDQTSARVSLLEPASPLESPVEVEVTLPGKERSTLRQLSGGERSLAFIALFLAINLVHPLGFVVMDEADSALDEVNVVRFASLVRSLTDQLQVILITHNKATMEFADLLVGVTAASDGASMVVPVSLEEARRLVEQAEAG